MIHPIDPIIGSEPAGRHPRDELVRISFIVRYNAPSWIDKEALVHDIWIESWRVRTPLPQVYIKHRIMNRIRDENRKRARPFEDAPDEGKGGKGISSQDPSWLVDLQDSVSLLMTGASLTGRESRVISLLFWSGFSVQEAATMLEISTQALSSIRDAALSKLRTQSLLQETTP